MGNDRHAARRGTVSANGTSAADNTTATFSKAGAYAFQVTITGPGGLTATSTVNVTVDPTLTTIVVNLPSATLPGTTQQFAATGFDQFGNALATQPAFTWSLTGSGSLTAGGLYTPPYASGTATVEAASGGPARPPPSPFPGKLNGFRPALPRGPPAAIGRTRPPTT